METQIQTKLIKTKAFEIRAVNHPIRQQILILLAENGTMNVTDIYVKLRLEQSVASQHLKPLRIAQFIDRSKEGKYVFYSLAEKSRKYVHVQQTA